MPTEQRPIRSGFDAASTSADVIAGVNLVGKVAIVTGGYAGLGLETARTLALAGARVIVPARDVERARRVVAEAGGGVEIWPMDLTDPQSIDRFAGRFVQSGLPLHILVNSAGIMAVPVREVDGRGNELQFSTNHLGHFQLAARLWPALLRGGQGSGGARIVSVSSLGHRFSPVVFDDINFERRDYEPWSAYGQSKTANILFAVELDRLAEKHGVRAFSLHPGGIVGTGLAKHMTEDMLRKAGAIDENGAPVVDLSRDLKSVPQGAATQIWCAVSPQLAGMGGVFCLDSDIATVLPEGGRGTQPGSGPRLAGVEAYAIDQDAAKRLWTVSEEMTGMKFPV